MKTQELISSGLLELYVAGSLSEEESRAITKKIESNPILLQEVIEIEAAYCNLSSLEAYPLNDDWCKKIIQSIEQEEDSKNLQPHLKSLTLGGKKVNLQYNNSNTSRFNSYLPYLAIAAMLVLVISSTVNIFMLKELQETSNQVALVSEEEQNIAIGTTNISINKVRQEFNSITKANLQSIPLQLIKDAPSMSAAVFVDIENQTLFIDANQLLMPPSGKQWQVWGETKIGEKSSLQNLGLLALKTNDDNFFQLKNNTSSSFEHIYLSLEPIGGNSSPTDQEIYLSN